MPLVMVDAEYGAYLGNFWGLGFWSKLDPAGQDSAVTFRDEAEAREHIASWDHKGEGRDIRFVEVHEVDSQGYAPRAACVAAGIEDWDDSIPQEKAPTLAG